MLTAGQCTLMPAAVAAGVLAMATASQCSWRMCLSLLTKLAAADTGSQRRKNRKRKAAGDNGARTLQHAGGGVLRQSNSGAQQPHMAAESAGAAADSQLPAAANWTSVKSFWHVPPGKTKPVKVKDVNALARETNDQVRKQPDMLDCLDMQSRCNQLGVCSR